MQKNSILIADHYPVARRGLRDLLARENNWEVVGEAVNALDAVGKAKHFRPDLVILNGALPRLSGVEAARRIKGETSNTRVLVLVSHSDRELTTAIFDGIVDGVALHSDSELKLISCVRKVLYGQGFVSTASFRQSEEPPFAPSGLTGRERQVLRLLGEGMCSKEVAAALRLSVRTVENHRARMMRRMEIKSFAELLRYGVREGLIYA
jgi:DNA-binding NarL/FixJ family response regulator